MTLPVNGTPDTQDLQVVRAPAQRWDNRIGMVMGLYRNKVYVGLQNTVISITHKIFEKNNHIGE